MKQKTAFVAIVLSASLIFSAFGQAATTKSQPTTTTAANQAESSSLVKLYMQALTVLVKKQKTPDGQPLFQMYTLQPFPPAGYEQAWKQLLNGMNDSIFYRMMQTERGVKVGGKVALAVKPFFSPDSPTATGAPYDPPSVTLADGRVLRIAYMYSSIASANQAVQDGMYSGSSVMINGTAATLALEFGAPLLDTPYIGSGNQTLDLGGVGMFIGSPIPVESFGVVFGVFEGCPNGSVPLIRVDTVEFGNTVIQVESFGHDASSPNPTAADVTKLFQQGN